MIPTVRWFKHDHDYRNFSLRHGLMRLHRAGVLRYREEPLRAAVNGGFSDVVIAHNHRHTSLISVSIGRDNRRCIVDSEDSFLCMAGIMAHADIYFCAGYNSAFFREKRFNSPYPWLRPHETAFYERRAAALIESDGAYFDRVRPFVPIGPNTGRTSGPGRLESKLRNGYDKLARQITDGEPWFFAYLDFELRYRSLMALRDRPEEHDVVLLDTLWGWPRHRVALHRQLADLAARGHDIHAKLNWAEPSVWDGSDQDPLDKSLFPMQIGAVSNYEAMLAASRMAVFASGFHWGWRNIMSFAMLLGLPIFADRIFLEPWFDMSRFEIAWNDSPQWDGLGAALGRVTGQERARIGARNQAAYDDLLAPERVAEYFVAGALA